MNRINIERYYSRDCVIGLGYCLGFNFFTLELPYFDNQINISSIHPGVYKAVKYQSPSFGREVILLKDVPGRTFIELHPGNYTSQILGCILPGDAIKYIDGDGIPDVVNSTATLDKILSLLPNEFEISIM